MNTSILETIIIEGQQQALTDLKVMLGKHCPQVKVAHCAQSVSQTVEMLQSQTANVWIVDLSIPGLPVKYLLHRLHRTRSSTIVTTSLPKACNDPEWVRDLLYLKRPFQAEQLVEVIQQVQRKRLSADICNAQKRLKIANKDGLHLLHLHEIIKLIASNNRSLIYTHGGNAPIQTARTLKTFDFLEEWPDFCRIHHSHLINLRFVQKYYLMNGGMVTLSDGSHLSISRQNLPKFLEKMEMQVLSA